MKTFTVWVFYTLFAVTQAVPINDLDLVNEWNLFKTRYAKKYDTKIEEQSRMEIFLENKRKIDQHNKLYSLGKVSFKMEMNRFGDMSGDEYAKWMKSNNVAFQENNTVNTIKKRSIDNSTVLDFSDLSIFIPPFNFTAPSAIDWRALRAVTGVKDQGECGSCWAFSVIGALEGQIYRKTGELVSLSEQNLIDCAADHGCDGGNRYKAFEYIKANGGIITENSYPYEEVQGKCRYKKEKMKATVKGVVFIPNDDEEILKIAVASQGPISVSIDASYDTFQFHKKGVYYERRCSSSKTNHAVLVVGYGTTTKNQDYWIVKNSWGIDTHDAGYIKMARNRKNHCGIASRAIYPLV